MSAVNDQAFRQSAFLFKAHPWHGLPFGTPENGTVNCFVELLPSDFHKYEVDKKSGHLRLDRTHKYSSQCPVPYGFIPQTLCAEGVGAFCAERTGLKEVKGDGDPMDICVITEKAIERSEILAQVVPIGGLRMIDRRQADEKIIAVLYQDGVYGHWRDISDCPANLVDRLRHYFLTYKDLPGTTKNMEFSAVYGAEEAQALINASREDYLKNFPEVHDCYCRLTEQKA